MHSSGFEAVDTSGRATELGAEMLRVADNEFTQRYLELGRKLLQIKPGMTVADIGCGNCPYLPDLIEAVGPSGKLHLVDPSDQLLGQLKARPCESSGTKISIIKGNAQELPFESASIDAAQFVRVFQHLELPKEAIAETTRVLKPNGRFLAIDPLWPTLSFTGEDQEVSRLIANAASFRMKNWCGAARLPSMLAEHGLITDAIECVTRVMRSLQEAESFYALRERFSNLIDRGECTVERRDSWMAQAEKDSREGRFLCTLNLWLVAARKA